MGYKLIHRKGRNIQIVYDGGKPISTGCKTDAEVQAWLMKQEESLEDVKFGDYAREFYTRTDPNSVQYEDKIRGREYEESYYTDRQRRLELYAIPFFKEIKVKDITPKMIDRWFIGIRIRDNRLPSSGYRNLLLSNLSIVLDRAVYDEIIDTNPARQVRTMKYKPAKKSEPLTEHELDILFPNDLDSAVKVWGSTRKALFNYIFIDTGFRPSEILGLQWSDVNLESGAVYTDKQVDRNGKKIVHRIKTTNKGKKYKVGVLSQTTISFLKSIESRDSTDYIFWNKEKRLHSRTTSNYTFRKVVKDTLGRTDISQYKLRHAFMTRLIGKVPKELILELMGHTKWEACYDDRTKDQIISQLFTQLKAYS